MENSRFMTVIRGPWFGNQQRRAVVYEVATTPGLYRLRIEQSPDDHMPGGRVIWDADSNDLQEVLRKGREWVDDGRLSNN